MIFSKADREQIGRIEGHVVDTKHAAIDSYGKPKIDSLTVRIEELGKWVTQLTVSCAALNANHKFTNQYMDSLRIDMDKLFKLYDEAQPMGKENGLKKKVLKRKSGR